MAKSSKNKLYKKDLESILTVLEKQKKEVLVQLLNEYSQRWRHNSSQIWQTGAIFIPFSLSGIALGIDDFYKTTVVALFSVSLIWIWHALSQSLRAIIERNWRIYAAVESSLLKLEPPRLNYGIDEFIIEAQSKRFRKMALGKIRKNIAVVITLIWLVAISLSFLKKIQILT